MSIDHVIINAVGGTVSLAKYISMMDTRLRNWSLFTIAKQAR